MITNTTIYSKNLIHSRSYLISAKCITNLICAFSIMMAFALPSFINAVYADSHNEQLTEVYKSIGPDGSISFSDTPRANAQSIKVKPITTVPAFVPTIKNETKAITPNNLSPGQDDIHYTEFSFIEPANDSSFYAASGSVQIILKLEPGLDEKHKVKILLDNKPIALKQSLTHTLTNIDRGTHTLTALVQSHENTILKSASTRFTIHRPSIKR